MVQHGKQFLSAFWQNRRETTVLRGGSISFLRFVLRRGIFAALTATSAAASACGGCGGAACSRRPQSRPRLSASGAGRGFRRVGSFAVRLALARGAALAVLVGIAGQTFAARLIAARGSVGFAFRRACQHRRRACFHSSARRTSRRLRRCPCRGLCRRGTRGRRGGNGGFSVSSSSAAGTSAATGAVHCSGGTMRLGRREEVQRQLRLLLRRLLIALGERRGEARCRRAGPCRCAAHEFRRCGSAQGSRSARRGTLSTCSRRMSTELTLPRPSGVATTNPASDGGRARPRRRSARI